MQIYPFILSLADTYFLCKSRNPANYVDMSRLFMPKSLQKLQSRRMRYFLILIKTVG